MYCYLQSASFFKCLSLHASKVIELDFIKEKTQISAFVYVLLQCAVISIYLYMNIYI